MYGMKRGHAPINSVNTVFILIIIYMKIKPSVLDVRNHALVGGKILTYCDSLGLDIPPSAAIKAISIRKHTDEHSMDTVYFHGPMAFEVHPRYIERWHVSYTGIEREGQFLILHPNFNISVSISPVNTTEQGIYTCRVTFQPITHEKQNILYFSEKNILSLFVHASGPNSKCENEWIYYKSMKESCMRAFYDPLTWDDARTECTTSHNGDLVVVDALNKERYAAGITGMKAGAPFWIGLKNTKANSKFVWVSQSGNSNYRYWKHGYNPKATSSESCVAKGGSDGGRWTAESCEQTFYYICERHTGIMSTSFTQYEILKMILVFVSIIGGIVLFISIIYACRSERAQYVSKKVWKRIKTLRPGKRKRGSDATTDSEISDAASEGIVVVVYNSELNEIVEDLPGLEMPDG